MSEPADAERLLGPGSNEHGAQWRGYLSAGFLGERHGDVHDDRDGQIRTPPPVSEVVE